jgi:hypothetical protein
MSYSSALPRQSDTLSPDPKQGFAATDWAGLRKQLILLHPVARQLVGNSDTRSREQYLWGAIHGAAEDVSAICDAVGRNMEVTIEPALYHSSPPRPLLPRLTAFLRSILCFGTGHIQINAAKDFDRNVPICWLRIMGTGVEVSDEARLRLLELAHDVSATTSIVTTKAECIVGIKIPLAAT